MKRTILPLLRALSALAVVLGISGCTSASDDDDSPRCIVGETRACACVDGSNGAQACNEIGTFDACVCGVQDVGLDTDGDTGTDAATDVMGDSSEDTGDDAGFDTSTCDCDASEYCTNGECVPREPCQNAGDSCDENTLVTDEFVCIVSSGLTPNEFTCLPACETTDDCLAGESCGSNGIASDPDETGYGCVPSDCSDAFAPEDCDALGDNGGTCRPYDNNVLFCSGAGTTQQGEQCETDDECAAGMGCIGTCQWYCSLDSDEVGCDNGGACIDYLGSDSVGICSACSGLDASADECPDGLGCFPVLNGDEPGGVCVAVGSRAVGAPCQPDAPSPQCGPLSVCSDFSGRGETACQALCDPDGAAPGAGCDGNEVCVLGFGALAVGVCADGCDTLADPNTCDDSAQVCLPQDTGGRCLVSGDVEIGEACSLVDGGVFGDCRTGACVVEDGGETGVCQTLCRTFSAAGGYDSECPGDQYCEIFGSSWGVCTPATQQVDPFEPCETAGEFCDHDVICLQVDQQGNNLCLPLCRLGDSFGDDCASLAVPAACDQVLDSDTIGLCIPT